MCIRDRQNAVTKKIPAMKKAGEDTSAVLAEMKALSDAVRAENEKLDVYKRQPAYWPDWKASHVLCAAVQRHRAPFWL